jgi:hypothetical protein
MRGFIVYGIYTNKKGGNRGEVIKKKEAKGFLRPPLLSQFIAPLPLPKSIPLSRESHIGSNG